MVNNKSIKYKYICEDKLLLYCRVLFKFKNPSLKIDKVFLDILDKYLFYPKISIKHINFFEEKLLDEVINIIEIIWNNSVFNVYKKNYKYNNILFRENDYAFYLNSYEKKFFQSKIVLTPMLKKLQISKFPITKKIVLTEGITEKILIPEFAKIWGFDFIKNKVNIIACGGKNNVAKYYLNYINYVKLPILIILDNDAFDIDTILGKKLRDKDKIYILKNGEFEDLLNPIIIKRAINKEYKNIINIKAKDINKKVSRVEALKKLYNLKHLGTFSKCDFAKIVKNSLSKKIKIPYGILEVLVQIKRF